MTIKELVNKRTKYERVKKCAKALYLTGELKDVFYYLDAMTEIGEITDNDGDNITEEISTECAGLTVGEIKAATDALNNLKRTMDEYRKAM